MYLFKNRVYKALLSSSVANYLVLECRAAAVSLKTLNVSKCVVLMTHPEPIVYLQCCLWGSNCPCANRYLPV